jgi:hypothetical protein
MSRIRYQDLPTGVREVIEAEYGSDPTGETAAKVKRQMQRHPGSMPGRGPGRPKLTEAEAAESKVRRREYMCEHMRQKRVLAKFGAPPS